MPAYAGPAPWYQGVSETYKNGRRKNRLVSGDQEWDLSTGWHAKRKNNWHKLKNTKKEKVTLNDGTVVDIYD